MEEPGRVRRSFDVRRPAPGRPGSVLKHETSFFFFFFFFFYRVRFQSALMQSCKFLRDSKSYGQHRLACVHSN